MLSALPRPVRKQTSWQCLDAYFSYIRQSKGHHEAYFHPQKTKNRAAHHCPIFLVLYKIVVLPDIPE